MFSLTISASYHLTSKIFLNSPLITIISSIKFYKLITSPQNSPGVRTGSGTSVIEVKSSGFGIILPGIEFWQVILLCACFLICDVDIMMYWLVLPGRNLISRELLLSSFDNPHLSFSKLPVLCSGNYEWLLLYLGVPGTPRRPGS